MVALISMILGMWSICNVDCVKMLFLGGSPAMCVNIPYHDGYLHRGESNLFVSASLDCARYD